jgi:hypothetical protein
LAISIDFFETLIVNLRIILISIGIKVDFFEEFYAKS